MASCGVRLVSYGDSFVTVCTYGRADCCRDLQLGRPHGLLSPRAGTRRPAEGEAVLLRRVLPARRDRHDLLRYPATARCRGLGRAPTGALSLQHQGLSEPDGTRA